MINNEPVLSICIPTYKRVEITRDTIKSIYADLEGVDLNDFEVIVSDNDIEESSRTFETDFKYPNFHYHATECEGFLNSFYVLSYGRGKFLKLQNNVSHFKKGSLKYMLNQAKNLLKNKPVIFYTNGMLGKHSVSQYDNIDDFLINLSFYSSWSAGFAIWKSDFDKIKDASSINRWFPQTSLLLESSKGKDSFIIDDNTIREGKPVSKKGGYNPYEVFGVSFLDLYQDYVNKGLIKSSTLSIVKEILFKKYLSSRYLKTVILRKDSFDHSNIQKHLSKYYGRFAFLKLIFYALIYPFNK